MGGLRALPAKTFECAVHLDIPSIARRQLLKVYQQHALAKQSTHKGPATSNGSSFSHNSWVWGCVCVWSSPFDTVGITALPACLVSVEPKPSWISHGADHGNSYHAAPHSSTTAASLLTTCHRKSIPQKSHVKRRAVSSTTFPMTLLSLPWYAVRPLS
eukprot:1616944-Amphidinium_carterae.1